MQDKSNSRILPNTTTIAYDLAEFRDIGYRAYRAELRELRVQLLRLQEWIEDAGRRVAVVLEGRDAAGKGTTAAAITRYLNPRSAEIISQGVPTRRQMRNWLGTHHRMLPKPGTLTIFDRSWYSRALVQPAMGYCTMKQYHYFLSNVNAWEENIVGQGVDLLKVYLSVSREAQNLRFRLRQSSELKYWKYSANDRRVAERWQMFTYFKERMFAVTSTDYAPWVIIDSDNKHQARLNVIYYLLARFNYEGRDLSLHTYEAEKRKSGFNMIVDGVLFQNLSADQIRILERIHMHE